MTTFKGTRHITRPSLANKWVHTYLISISRDHLGLRQRSRPNATHITHTYCKHNNWARCHCLSLTRYIVKYTSSAPVLMQYQWKIHSARRATGVASVEYLVAVTDSIIPISWEVITVLPSHRRPMCCITSFNYFQMTVRTGAPIRLSCEIYKYILRGIIQEW